MSSKCEKCDSIMTGHMSTYLVSSFLKAMGMVTATATVSNHYITFMLSSEYKSHVYLLIRIPV